MLEELEDVNLGMQVRLSTQIGTLRSALEALDSKSRETLVHLDESHVKVHKVQLQVCVCVCVCVRVCLCIYLATKSQETLYIYIYIYIYIYTYIIGL